MIVIKYVNHIICMHQGPLLDFGAGPGPDYFVMECAEVMQTDAGYNLWIQRLATCAKHSEGSGGEKNI